MIDAITEIGDSIHTTSETSPIELEPRLAQSHNNSYWRNNRQKLTMPLEQLLQDLSQEELPVSVTKFLKLQILMLSN